MQALWLEDKSISLRADIPVPTPLEGEALIQIGLAGICSTDLELVKGYYPFSGVLGHEFVGTVLAAPAANHWVGRRVVGEINLSCGSCLECRAGNPTHCVRRTVLGIAGKDGCFAEYITLPLANLHSVPDDLPDEAAVFTEPLAAACEITEKVHIRPQNRVLIIGAGRLGQLITRVLVTTGAELFVSLRRESQGRLLEGLGVTLLNPASIPERSMDVVVEATGSAAGFEQARQALRPRGTLVLKSTYQGDLTLNMSKLVVDEITLVGSRCGPFPPALRLMDNGQVNPLPLISARYPLSQAVEAFKHASQPGVFKVLLEPG